MISTKDAMLDQRQISKSFKLQTRIINSRSLGQDSQNVGHLPGEFLSSKTDEICGWNHGNVGQDELESMLFRQGPVHRYRGWHKGP